MGTDNRFEVAISTPWTLVGKLIYLCAGYMMLPISIKQERVINLATYYGVAATLVSHPAQE